MYKVLKLNNNLNNLVLVDEHSAEPFEDTW